MKKMWFGVFICITLLLSSCARSLTPLTEEYVKTYSEYLGEIKFFTSDEIVMRSDSASEEVETKKGVVYDYTGKHVERIVIPRGTPGTIVSLPGLKPDRLALTFNNDPEAYNIFGPNPKKKKYYTLLAEDWTKSEGTVTFKDKKWFVGNNTGLVFLEFDLKKIKKEKIKTTVLKGSSLKSNSED